MRSIAFTLCLLVGSLVLCGLVGWRLREGNLDALLGVPPTPVGELLYDDFREEDVHFIDVTAGGAAASFQLDQQHVWQATSPWRDRMDPRAAHYIIQFTLGMRVEDLSPAENIDDEQAGFDENMIRIRLRDAGGGQLAYFRLGRRSPWNVSHPEGEEPTPTVFVLPRDKNRKSHVYLCTGNINPLFKDGLRFLRDHRPFYFHPASLEKLRIRGAEGELTLARETPQSAWRIVKPLELRTSPAAIKSLLEGLYQLQAVRVSDRESVTLPSGAAGARQIALQQFGSETETVLDIFPPPSQEAREVLATVNDRPGAVLSLPLRPEAELVSLADLPLTVNDLRDPALTNLNIASLQSISIEPSTGLPILISRENPRLWTTRIQGRVSPANEQRLYDLLTAVTGGRVSGFETDAATDFAPWGLDRPFLKLRFTGQDDQVLELRFGFDGHGAVFVNRTGTPSVMRVDSALLESIAVTPHEWRHARVWSLSRPDLVAISKIAPPAPRLELRYEFAGEQWQAWSGTENVTDELVQARANFLLGALEGLEVSRWLSATDAGAAKALMQPVLGFVILENQVDDFGELKGIRRHEIEFAPVPENPNAYYGRTRLDLNPFLIDRTTFRKLAVDLFGGD